MASRAPYGLEGTLGPPTLSPPSLRSASLHGPFAGPGVEKTVRKACPTRANTKIYFVGTNDIIGGAVFWRLNKFFSRKRIQSCHRTAVHSIAADRLAGGRKTGSTQLNLDLNSRAEVILAFDLDSMERSEDLIHRMVAWRGSHKDLGTERNRNIGTNTATRWESV